MSLTNPFHAELVEHIHVAAFDRGYDVVVSPLTGVRDERQTALRLVDQRCEALILLGPSLTRRELESLAGHTSVVVVGRRLTAQGVAVVRAADDRGVATAVRHLTDPGHRRVAYVDGPRGPIATLRREGFRRAMRRFADEGAPLVVSGGDTELAGMRAPLPHGAGAPTAYVCFNDRCALGVVDQLRAAGLDVPNDVGRGLRRQPGGPAPDRLPHDGQPVAGGDGGRSGGRRRRPGRRWPPGFAPGCRPGAAAGGADELRPGQWLSCDLACAARLSARSGRSPDRPPRGRGARPGWVAPRRPTAGRGRGWSGTGTPRRGRHGILNLSRCHAGLGRGQEGGVDRGDDSLAVDGSPSPGRRRTRSAGGWPSGGYRSSGWRRRRATAQG